MTRSPQPSPPVPADLEFRSATEVLQLALQMLGEANMAVAVSFSAEDMVLLGLFDELKARPRVFTIDTGRLPRATLEAMAAARSRFGVDIEVFRPDPAAVADMVDGRGVNLFYRSLDDRRWCCDVRRVEPLRRALAGSAGWVTGLRREQTPSRAAIPKIFPDPAQGGLWKVAPLADWSGDDVWRHIAEHRLPYNRLYDEGYQSIGCDPCTRAVADGGEPRSGRWWWEQGSDGECGMHVRPRTN